VGKTTSAVYLASLSARARSTVLIDADAQGSAAEFLDEMRIPDLECVEAPSVRTLRAAISRVGDSKLVIIDTPPANSEVLLEALAHTDAAVVCSRTGALEVGRVALTLRIIPTGIPRFILLTASNPRTRAHREMVDGWQSAGEKIIGVIRARTAVATDMRLDEQACTEYAAVLDTLLTQHNTSQHNLT
jgi:chromosome partitioning protein